MKALLVILTVIPLMLGAEEVGKFPDGQMLEVEKEGGAKKFHLVKNEAGKSRGGYQLGVGFPAFKNWSIKYTKGVSLPLLEATVISTNTGMSMQGAEIYLEYEGGEPRLFAISDVEGQIKMRVDPTMHSVGLGVGGARELRLVCVYVGNPNVAGSHTRIYNVPSSLKKQ